MSPASVQIGDSVICQKLNDEAVLLDLSTQNYYGLNASGAQIWDALVRTNDPRMAAQELSDFYHLPLEAVAEDVQKVLKDLIALGLVTPVTA